METREQAILTAVNFLTNPRVQKSSLVQKRNFLRSKGLNDDEIQKSFEKAGIFHQISDLEDNDNNETRIQITSTTSPPMGSLNKTSVFEKIKSLAGSFALISGIAYGIYLFYKNYVEAFLFGRKKKSDKIDELTRTTKAVNGELLKIRDDINKQKQIQESNHKLIQTSLQAFKSEIETIKGILLNKKQFATPSSMSIPSWQLNNKKSQQDTDAHSANSSENDTEVIHEDSSQKRSPANSDSSLEIM